MGGKHTDLGRDDDILKIQSPRERVGDGPYVVVHKHTDERWAIVALDWDGPPREVLTSGAPAGGDPDHS